MSGWQVIVLSMGQQLSTSFSPEERAAAAALAAVDGIGRRTLRRVFDTLTKAKLKSTQFWDLGPGFWSHLALTKKQMESLQKFVSEYTYTDYFNALKKRQIRVMFSRDSDWPSALTNIDDPPEVLFVQAAGELPWIKSRCPNVAVIGSRSMTGYGRLATHQLVGGLVAAKATIVSGVMYGVDQTAHEVACQLNGTTIGVLGYGFDHCYPATVARVRQDIIQHGCLLSEYPPHVRPSKGGFAARNRLISGLSQAVVVVEAAQRSGTLITAECALDQVRTVCAVPGPISSPYSQGTKWLLNQGAVLVNSAADILIELGVTLSDKVVTAPNEESTSSITNRVINCLKLLPSDLPQLIANLQADPLAASISVGQIFQAVTELEINGSIMRNGSTYELSHC